MALQAGAITDFSLTVFRAFPLPRSVRSARHGTACGAQVWLDLHQDFKHFIGRSDYPGIRLKGTVVGQHLDRLFI